MKKSMIGLDLAKNVFQVHGKDASGAVVLRRQLRRGAARARRNDRNSIRDLHQGPRSMAASGGLYMTAPDPFAEAPRNPCRTGASIHEADGYGGSPPDAAMISCNVATCLANARRPAAVAVTVVCGFFPTKAFSTPT